MNGMGEEYVVFLYFSLTFLPRKVTNKKKKNSLLFRPYYP